MHAVLSLWCARHRCSCSCGLQLVECGKAQLVVVAHDVDPVELVVWLPALCKKMGVPYCIVKVRLAQTGSGVWVGATRERGAKLANSCVPVAMSIEGDGARRSATVRHGVLEKPCEMRM